MKKMFKDNMENTSINKNEQEGIVTAPLGRAFLITSPMTRLFIDIYAYDMVKVIIGEAKK